MTKSGNGLFTIDPSVALDCVGGAISVDSGTLALPGSQSAYSNDVFNATANTGLDLVPNNNLVNFTGTLTGSGAGQIQLNYGALIGQTATLDFAPGLFQWVAGQMNCVITNTGDLTLTSTNNHQLWDHPGVSGTDFYNAGRVHHAAGTLTLSGNYTQNGGALKLVLGGAGAGQPGRLVVGGDAALSGSLDVTLAKGFVPNIGDQFQILSGSSLGGAFDSSSLPFGAVLTNESSSTFAGDFSSGIQTNTWTIPQTAPALYSIGVTNGLIRMTKNPAAHNPGGLQDIAASLNLAPFGGAISGDFSAQITFTNAVLPGPGLDQVQLNLGFQNGWVFDDVYDNSGGARNVHVWTASVNGQTTITNTAGTFRITRTGGALSAYYNAKPIFSENNTSPLTSLNFVLQNNNNSDDDTAVGYENFSLGTLSGKVSNTSRMKRIPSSPDFESRIAPLRPSMRKSTPQLPKCCDMCANTFSPAPQPWTRGPAALCPNSISCISYRCHAAQCGGAKAAQVDVGNHPAWPSCLLRRSRASSPGALCLLGLWAAPSLLAILQFQV